MSILILNKIIGHAIRHSFCYSPMAAHNAFVYSIKDGEESQPVYRVV